ncbi:hypothetical protein SPFL3102_00840 [Sporomusaceae bacterium FL31]|nr:hypothetical protein SPFL3101_00682 [Sporomusaceae bacterium FL31]GCE33039.1 hypothetical protein SPFL3102_00840 [Sporomusaceae bacterium]
MSELGERIDDSTSHTVYAKPTKIRIYDVTKTPST